jgi:hypothetical protein
MKDRAKAIFQTADAYSRSAILINSVVNNDPSQFLPSQVNAALALELYFKTLYYIEKQSDFKVKNKHSHDFHALFNELPVVIQAQLDCDFQAIMNGRDMRDADTLETKSKVKVPRDLAGNLKAWSEVFTKVRYAYDERSQGTSMMFFPEIERAVRNAICRLRPDLQS